MKRLTLYFIFLLSFNLHCFSQGNVRFTYDASGNRISRSIVSSMNSKGGFFEEKTSSVNSVFEGSVRVSVLPTSQDGVFSLGFSPVLIGSKLLVYNSKGMLILEETIKLETISLDLSSYPKDIYLLTIPSGNQPFTRKIIR